MPQATKKIYPTITGQTTISSSEGYTIYNRYNVNTDKVAYQTTNNLMKLTYDTSIIKNVINAKVVTRIERVRKRATESWPVKVHALLYCNELSYSKEFSETSAGYNNEISLNTEALSVLESSNSLTLMAGTNATYTLLYEINSERWLVDVYFAMGNVEGNYIECVCIEPSITEFSVNGTSIDSQIVCSWTQEDVENWEVQAIQNNVVVASKTGTNATSCIFNAGELNKGGSTTFKLIAKYGEVSVEESTTVELSYTQAKATLIDIPGTTINIDKKFTIAWVSENQTSFELTVDGKTYTGTTEKSITLPANTISKGIKTISLTVNFKNAYYSNSSTISTTFTAYGKPSAPVITNKSIVNSALPCITWTSSDQVAYLVTIKKLIETIETSGEILSQAKYYQVINALENNTSYKVTVKVKNQYGLWSNEAEFEFSTQFTVPNTPVITAIADTTNGAIILNVSTNVEDDTEYKNTEIWKREPLGEWKRMAYNLSSDDAWSDFYVGNEVEYEYKARNIGQTGGISESDVIVASTVVKGYTLYNVEDLESKLVFKYDVEITPKLITNIVTNLFAGANAPQTSTDGTMYWNCLISFKTTERNDIFKLIKLMKSSKVLLFKDCRGHKYFGNIIGNPSFPETELRIISIQIEFNETSFFEQDVYSGDNTDLKLVKWDGTWRFNGSQS